MLQHIADEVQASEPQIGEEHKAQNAQSVAVLPLSQADDDAAAEEAQDHHAQPFADVPDLDV